MEDIDKLPGDYTAEEYVPPNPEINYQSPNGMVRVTVEREFFKGSRDEPPHSEETYFLLINRHLISHYESAEMAKEAAIECLEKKLEACYGED